MPNPSIPCYSNGDVLDESNVGEHQAFRSKRIWIEKVSLSLAVSGYSNQWGCHTLLRKAAAPRRQGSHFHRLGPLFHWLEPEGFEESGHTAHPEIRQDLRGSTYKISFYRDPEDCATWLHGATKFVENESYWMIEQMKHGNGDRGSPVWVVGLVANRAQTPWSRRKIWKRATKYQSESETPASRASGNHILFRAPQSSCNSICFWLSCLVRPCFLIWLGPP